MAIAQVLGTYELLENILLQLPLRQLLFAQRVSTSFRDLIWRSGRINRVLFFTSAADDSLQWYHPESVQLRRESEFLGEWKSEAKGKTVWPILNPFLPAIETSYAAVEHDPWLKYKRLGILVSEDQGEQKFWKAEELAFSTPPRRFYCDHFELDWEGKDHKGVDGTPLEDFLIEHLERLPNGSNGSFRDMLITHPPCRAIRLLTDVPERTIGHYSAQDIVKQEEDVGVRFGPLIYDAAFMASEQNPYRHENDHHAYERATIEVVGARLWQKCPKSVDEMTGWEMLRLFEVGVETFEDEMQL